MPEIRLDPPAASGPEGVASLLPEADENDLLRSALESTGDGILVVDLAQRVALHNQRFADLWRLPPALLAGGDARAIQAAALEQLTDPESFLARIQELHAAPGGEQVDLLRLRDGRVLERHSRPQLVRGRTVGRVLCFRDVTARVRAEEELLRSEEKHRAILAGLEECYFETDLEGRFTFLSGRAVQVLGFDPARLLGHEYREFLDAQNARKVRGAFGAVYGSGQPLGHVEWDLRRPDGTVAHLASSASLRRGPDGAPLGFRGLVLDFTERKRAEQALRDSEERYRRLVELVPDGVVVHADGKLLFANAAAASMVGAASPAELQGRPVLEILHPDSRSLAVQRMRALQEGREPGVAEQKLLRRDGTSVLVEVSALPFSHQGRPAALVVMRDVTEPRHSAQIQSALYRIAQLTSTAQDMADFYGAVHAIVGELMYARNFYIALGDEAGDTLQFPYFVDEVDPNPGTVPLGRTLTGHVLRTGRPLLCSPEVFGQMLATGEIELSGAPSLDWLGVPLKRGERAFGVLVVQSYSEGRRFGEADRDLLTFVSRHVATAIDRKRSADALRESEAKFRTLAETTPVGIFIQQGGRLTYANHAMVAISGYGREDLLRMGLWDLVHPEFRNRVRELGPEAADHDAPPPEPEFQVVCRDGSTRWLAVSSGRIEYQGRAAVLGSAFDVTERRRADEQIRSLAFQDALTGLPNRRLFADRLDQALARAHRTGERLAVFFLDLDRFKLINDSLGHAVGDALLQSVAARLRESVREGDTVARVGGDEFVLLLPGIAQAVDVAKVARKILDGLRGPALLGGHELVVTASLGISLYPEDGADAEALVQNADAAMYRAKEEGRDGYQLYTRAMNATALERLALENSLRRALGAGEFLLHYQPVLDIASGRVHGVEALLRWRHPDMGLVPPADFIPLAEATGLILPIGPWVLAQACAQVRAWQGHGHPQLCVAVNLSARQFRQPDLVARVTAVLDQTGLQPRFLELEITETSAMEEAETTVATLRQLKALGVRVSIDDFGVGYSSLAYLKRLPIDTLKVDQSFVRDIGTDPDDAAIVSAVVAMAHSLKLAVVAEGVETEQQLGFLSARGCQRMQGYLFSPPLPPAECGELLDRHRRA